MASERVERKLAAILAADVAGYSRMAGADEERTLARLRALRGDLIDPAIAAHHGRVVKRTGDGILIEFRSVVDAVRCAIEVQNGMAERNAGLPPERRIEFRVGVHLGDVIEEADGDLMGDGVNIAARLEGIAEPGGICLSEDAYRQVRDRLNEAFVDLGDQTLKNIAHPVRVYAIKTGPDGSATAASTRALTLGRPCLSIVVLPFANLGGDPAQDYFVDGVTDSLTTDLSRLRDYFVVARKSALAYGGREVDIRQVGRELGVRYVVEGSMQRRVGRVRVNVQLIDAETGAHVWAERFDQPAGALLDMQEEITTRLARALDVQLVAAEGRRLEQERSGDLNSVELALRGWAIFFRTLSVSGMREARGMFEAALRVDGNNTDALFGLAETHVWEVNNYLSNARAEQIQVAEAAIAKAQRLAPHDPRIRFGRAGVLLAMRLPEQALREMDVAISIDRDLPWLHASSGRLKIFVGRAEETEGHVREAMRLSPRDPLLGIWYYFIGLADLHLGRVDRAVERLQRSVDLDPKYEISHFYLAAALAQMGRTTEAAAACAVGRRLAPNVHIAKLQAEAQSDNPIFLAQRERIYEGMRKAGVPEGPGTVPP